MNLLTSSERTMCDAKAVAYWWGVLVGMGLSLRIAEPVCESLLERFKYTGTGQDTELAHSVTAASEC